MAAQSVAGIDHDPASGDRLRGGRAADEQTRRDAGVSSPDRAAGVAFDRVAEAIRWLDDHAVEQPSLAELARALHVSPAHLQRQFTRLAGTSPKRFVRWLTADAARRLLRERATTLATAEAVGLSSTGRLHDLLVSIDGVTPGEVGADGEGLTIAAGVHPTPLGEAFVAVTERGVCMLRFLDGAPRSGGSGADADGGPGRMPGSGARDGLVHGEAEARAELSAAWPRAQVVDEPARTGAIADLLTATAGDAGPGAVPLPLLLKGTNLQLKVWEALLRVPDGRVTTYGDLAAAVGRPSAVRAVANAVGRNPVAVFVPCHRVLRGTGALGGYRWGEARKRVLLAREAARVPEPTAP